MAVKLRGRVDVWWDQLQKFRQHMGKSPITSWEKMKTIRMVISFLPLLVLHSDAGKISLTGKLESLEGSNLSLLRFASGLDTNGLKAVFELESF